MPNNEYATKARNIPEELHEAWKKMRRRNDMKPLMEFTGKSYPVISGALNNGYCATQQLADKISEYFAQRPEIAIKVSKKGKEIVKATQAE
jgi:hypothetical protein